MHKAINFFFRNILVSVQLIIIRQKRLHILHELIKFCEFKNIVKICFFRSLMASLKKEKQALTNVFAFLQRGLSIL
jgi:hypothetical protein